MIEIVEIGKAIVDDRGAAHHLQHRQRPWPSTSPHPRMFAGGLHGLGVLNIMLPALRPSGHPRASSSPVIIVALIRWLKGVKYVPSRPISWCAITADLRRGRHLVPFIGSRSIDMFM